MSGMYCRTIKRTFLSAAVFTDWANKIARRKNEDIALGVPWTDTIQVKAKAGKESTEKSAHSQAWYCLVQYVGKKVWFTRRAVQADSEFLNYLMALDLRFSVLTWKRVPSLNGMFKKMPISYHSPNSATRFKSGHVSVVADIIDYPEKSMSLTRYVYTIVVNNSVEHVDVWLSQWLLVLPTPIRMPHLSVGVNSEAGNNRQATTRI